MTGTAGTGGVRLRPLGPDDLDRIMELEAELFGAGAWSRRTYVEELTSVPGRTYLAAVVPHDRPGGRGARPSDDADEAGGDLVVGYAGLAGGDEAQVMTVGVDPAYRRRGIGAMLLRALLDAARDQGARTALLEVRASDEGAQRLYARAGFVPIGRRRNYYQAEREDAVVMRAQLRGTPGPVGAEVTG